MVRKISIILILAAIICLDGCKSIGYITDQQSINRQHEMKAKRTGVNAGVIGLSIANMFMAVVLNSAFVTVENERNFKKISIYNQSNDTLLVNMVTDVLWKDSDYCDVMGIVLPAGAKQKLLLPYPAAYNVFFKAPMLEEEKLEIRTDSKLHRIGLKPGMTQTAP